MSILSAADYPAIRAALDTSLDTSALPDQTIALDIYQGAAEREVKERDPDWAARTGTDALRLRAAAVFLTAARLTSAVIRVTSVNVQSRDLSYSRPVFDPAEKAAQLRALAEQELAALVTPNAATSGRPTMFSLASSRRGY